MPGVIFSMENKDKTIICVYATRLFMNDDVNPCLSGSDSNGVPYGARLKRLREAAGISPQEVARLVGLNVPSYFDAELCEGELNSALYLRELAQLAAVFSIPTSQLFEDRKPKQNAIAPYELVELIKNHLNTSHTTLERLEDKIGYEIKGSIDNPKSVLNWNVDVLRFVCEEVGVDWLSVLPVSAAGDNKRVSPA